MLKQVVQEDLEVLIMGRLLSSEAKLDLLTLFHDSPGLIDTVDGIALRVGRTASEIGKEVTDLLDFGLLLKKKIGKSEVIYLDTARDFEIQQMIAERLRRKTE